MYKSDDNNVIIRHNKDPGQWWCCYKNPSCNVIVVTKRYIGGTLLQPIEMVVKDGDEKPIDELNQLQRVEVWCNPWRN